MCRMTFWKGMGAGLAVGLALGAAIQPKRKCRSRYAARLLKTVGSVVDNVGGALGL